MFYLFPPSISNVIECLVLETGFFLNNLEKFKGCGLRPIEETIEMAIVSF